MTFSILMLTWNNMDKFYRCIHSMFYYISCEEVKEIIILDNGSHDETLKDFLNKLDEQVEKIHVVFSNTNLGIGKGRKKLYDMATGDYIISVDSDVVIINPPLLLKAIQTTLNYEDMYLIGGGGGDHPYYPTIEKEHIINKPTPKENTMTIVDEVAGWFHSFKTKHLVKNGGELYMDEQFSPFWAEDSDFCIQIKKLGKKCAILGEGLIAHAWSSSHKPETMKTADHMWELLRNKWYKDSPEFNIIKVDENLQKNYYNDNEEFVSTKWMINGIMENKLHNTEFIDILYPDLTYDNENGKLNLEDESFTIQEFVDKKVTKSVIKNKCVTMVEDTLTKCKLLTLLCATDEENTMKVLENCESINDLNFVLLLKNGFDHTKITSKIKQLTSNYRIYTYDNLHNKLKLITLLMEDMKEFQFENVLSISSTTNKEFLDNIDTDFNYYQSTGKDADLFGIELITHVFKIEKDHTYPENGDFFMPKNDFYTTIESLPFQKLMSKTLLFEENIPVNVMPRVSPEHSMVRLFGYLQSYEEKSSLLMLLCEINEEHELNEIKELIERFKKRKVDVLLINTGKLHKIKMSYLHLDYYYNVNLEDDKFITWLKLLSVVDVDDYNNVIFSTTDYELEEEDDLESFLDIAKYKSAGYILENNRIKSVLFSIYSSDLSSYSQLVGLVNEQAKKNKELDVTETIEIQMRKLNMEHMITL